MGAGIEPDLRRKYVGGLCLRRPILLIHHRCYLLLNMETQDIGYVALSFDDATKEKVSVWLQQHLHSSDVVTATIGGKEKGGVVTQKLHLTLFYGLNERLVNTETLSSIMNGATLQTVQSIHLGVFPVEQFGCSALYLEVADDTGMLHALHGRLSELPHLPGYQQEFHPHVTLAYVRQDIDLETFPNDFPKSLTIAEVVHIKK